MWVFIWWKKTLLWTSNEIWKLRKWVLYCFISYSYSSTHSSYLYYLKFFHLTLPSDISKINYSSKLHFGIWMFFFSFFVHLFWGKLYLFFRILNTLNFCSIFYFYFLLISEMNFILKVIGFCWKLNFPNAPAVSSNKKCH